MLILFVEYHDAFRQAASYLMDREDDLEVVSQAGSVAEAGWAGKKNGELLRLAEKAFDAFVTTDKGIPHQQNICRLGLAVVLLRAKCNAYEDLAPLMDEANDVLGSVEPGTVVRLPSNR